MWRLIAITVAFAVTGAHATPRLNGNDLRQLCSQSPARCLGYIQAVADLLHQSGCPGRTEVEAVATVLHYLRTHQDELSNNATSLIYLALAGDCAQRPLGDWNALGH
jgi:Rap1a immunity proteins